MDRINVKYYTQRWQNFFSKNDVTIVISKFIFDFVKSYEIIKVKNVHDISFIMM